MEQLFTTHLPTFHNTLRALIQQSYTNQHIAVVLNGQQRRPQLPLYTTSKTMESYILESAFLAEHETDANLLGFTFLLEWRSEPADLLKSMGMDFTSFLDGEQRAFRPQPILTPRVLAS